MSFYCKEHKASASCPV